MSGPRLCFVGKESHVAQAPSPVLCEREDTAEGGGATRSSRSEETQVPRVKH